MSTKEIDRYEILCRVKSKTLKQNQAALILGITPWQVRYLSRKLEIEGKQGLISKKRGEPSNR